MFFFGGLGLPRRAFFFVACVMSPTPPQRSLYIHGPSQTSAAKSSHIYFFKICGCIWLKFTCGQKESKPSKTHHVLLTVALVLLIWIRSISSISILMLLISLKYKYRNRTYKVRVSHKSIPQEFPTRVSDKSVP